MSDPWQTLATAAMLLPAVALVVASWLTIIANREARAALARCWWAGWSCSPGVRRGE